MSSARSRRINPDSMPVLWFTTGLIGVLGLTSFMVSFNGLHEVAAWAALPSWMRWTVPVFIDVAILAYSLAALVHRSRGEKTWRTWMVLGVFTAVSVAANAAHALLVGDNSSRVQSWIGAGIAALAPLGVFASTEELASLAVGHGPATEQEDPVSVSVEPVRDEEPAVELEETSHPSLGAVPPPSWDETAEEAPVSEQEQVNPEVFDQDSAPLPIVPAPTSAPAEEEPVADVVAEEPSVAETAEGPSPDSEAEPVVQESDPFAAWVKGELAEGRPVTGSTAAEHLGIQPRSARERLRVLRQERPEIFEGK